MTSDDDALLSSTGKVGELKRYDSMAKSLRMQADNGRVYNFWTCESFVDQLDVGGASTNFSVSMCISNHDHVLVELQYHSVWNGLRSWR